jgi:large subunit ribosomal protein L9e
LISALVTVKVAGRKVTITGPRGTLTRDFGHANVDIIYFPRKHQITVDVWFGNKLEKSCIKSVCTHINNMITGLTKVFLYSILPIFP